MSNMGPNLTFPQPPEPLQLEDLAVCLHGAVVAAGHPLQILLGLEAHLHHVCGLGNGHCHGPRSATSQDTDANIGIWCQEWRTRVDEKQRNKK